jgi:hypothetical protein
VGRSVIHLQLSCASGQEGGNLTIITADYRGIHLKGPLGLSHENDGTKLADRLAIALALPPYTASSSGRKPLVDHAARSRHE